MRTSKNLSDKACDKLVQDEVVTGETLVIIEGSSTPAGDDSYPPIEEESKKKRGTLRGHVSREVSPRGPTGDDKQANIDRALQAWAGNDIGKWGKASKAGKKKTERQKPKRSSKPVTPDPENQVKSAVETWFGDDWKEKLKKKDRHDDRKKKKDSRHSSKGRVIGRPPSVLLLACCFCFCFLFFVFCFLFLFFVFDHIFRWFTFLVGEPLVSIVERECKVREGETIEPPEYFVALVNQLSAKGTVSKDSECQKTKQHPNMFWRAHHQRHIQREW